MYFSAIKLLFILSSASVISGASVAERDYSPSHHSNQYEVSKDWDNREHPGWRNDEDEYDSRHSDYHNGNDKDYEKHYDIEHDDYERGGNRYEDRHDRYRNGSHHDKEDWDYDNEDSRNGRDHYIDDNIPSGDDISEGNGSSNSGSPSGGDGDAPNGQENVDPAAGNKDITKPGGSPAGDKTNIRDGNECHGNLIDGHIGVLDIKANVCLGLDLTGNIINNDQSTSSPGVPSGITEGITSGVPAGKSNGLPGGSGGDTIPNGPNTPKSPGAPAGDAERLQNGTPGAPSSLGNLNNPANQGGDSSSTNSGRCEDIAVKVRQLLGINADAVVCLDGLIRVDTRDRSNTGLGGLLPGVLNSGDDGKRRREICETIKVHANILGITVDAVICLPEIMIRV
ncbi:hypothetical protein K7432_010048 [Basidiobolus ranarum]|uniref:Uncharacterized protein n=1 Tax=Basidiobolus ranarum TaxID=34480 RepID=A0ABR2WPB9_9FUNG